MAHVTLKQLRYFDALAREQHFGRAAESCAVTQPALSMQIQELEAALGLALVERTRSGIKLTGKGEEIARRARRILNDTRDLVDFARQTGGTMSGELRLGVIPSIAPYMLPALLPLLKKTYPQLVLHVRETLTQPLTQGLLDGKLDCLLLALPIRHDEIECASLFKDHFLLVTPRSRKLVGPVRATPQMVEQDRLLLLEEGHCLRDQALTYCSLKNADVTNTFGASSLSTIVEMVAGGLGITLLPEICVGVEGRGRDLSIMRFADPEPSRTIGLAWRKSSPRTADFQALGDAVRTCAATVLHRNPLPDRKKPDRQARR
jgi:LysR family hydrogen peroxide-inducible transcriptional activator